MKDRTPLKEIKKIIKNNLVHIKLENCAIDIIKTFNQI